MSQDDLFMQRLQRAGGQQEPSPNPELDQYDPKAAGTYRDSPGGRPQHSLSTDDEPTAVQTSNTLEPDTAEAPMALSSHNSFSVQFQQEETKSPDGQTITTTIHTACAHIVTTETPSEIQTNVTLPDGQMISLNAGQVPVIVYAAFDFLRMVEGQVTVQESEELMLLDESNPFWWLVLKDTGDIGYIPADNIETSALRQARVNRDINVASARQQPQDRPLPVTNHPSSKRARGFTNVYFHEHLVTFVGETYHLDDYIDDEEAVSPVDTEEEEQEMAAEETRLTDGRNSGAVGSDENLQGSALVQAQGDLGYYRGIEEETHITFDQSPYDTHPSPTHMWEPDDGNSPVNERNAEAKLMLGNVALSLNQQAVYNRGATGAKVQGDLNQGHNGPPVSSTGEQDDERIISGIMQDNSFTRPSDGSLLPGDVNPGPSDPSTSTQPGFGQNQNFSEVYELNDDYYQQSPRVGSPPRPAPRPPTGRVEEVKAYSDGSQSDRLELEDEEELDDEPYTFVVAHHVERNSQDPSEFTVELEQWVTMNAHETFSDILQRILEVFELPKVTAPSVYRLLAYIDGFNFGISLAQDEFMYTLLEYVAECKADESPEHCLRFILKEDQTGAAADDEAYPDFGAMVSEPATPVDAVVPVNPPQTHVNQHLDDQPGDQPWVPQDTTMYLGPVSPSIQDTFGKLESKPTSALDESTASWWSTSQLAGEDSVMESMRRINQHLPFDGQMAENRRSVFDEAFGINDDSDDDDQRIIGRGSFEQFVTPPTSNEPLSQQQQHSILPSASTPVPTKVSVSSSAAAELLDEESPAAVEATRRSDGTLSENGSEEPLLITQEPTPKPSISASPTRSQPRPMVPRPVQLSGLGATATDETNSPIELLASTSSSDSSYDSANSSVEFLTPHMSNPTTASHQRSVIITPPLLPRTSSSRHSVNDTKPAQPPMAPPRPSLTMGKVSGQRPGDRPRSNLSLKSPRGSLEESRVVQEKEGELPIPRPLKRNPDQAVEDTPDGATSPAGAGVTPNYLLKNILANILPPSTPPPPSHGSGDFSSSKSSEPRPGRVAKDQKQSGGHSTRSYSVDHAGSSVGGVARQVPLSSTARSAFSHESLPAEVQSWGTKPVTQPPSVYLSRRNSRRPSTGSVRTSLTPLSPSFNVSQFSTDELLGYNPLNDNNLSRASVDMAPFRPSMDEEIQRRISMSEDIKHEFRQLSERGDVGEAIQKIMASPTIQASLPTESRRLSQLTSPRASLNPSPRVLSLGSPPLAGSSVPGSPGESASTNHRLSEVLPPPATSRSRSGSTTEEGMGNSFGKRTSHENKRVSWNLLAAASYEVQRRSSLSTSNPTSPAFPAARIPWSLEGGSEGNDRRRVSESEEYVGERSGSGGRGGEASRKAVPGEKIGDGQEFSQKGPVPTTLGAASTSISSPMSGAQPRTTLAGTTPGKEGGSQVAQTKMLHQRKKASPVLTATHLLAQDALTSPLHRVSHSGVVGVKSQGMGEGVGPLWNQEGLDDSDGSVGTMVTSPVVVSQVGGSGSYATGGGVSTRSTTGRDGETSNLNVWLTLLRGLEPLPEDQLVHACDLAGATPGATMDPLERTRAHPDPSLLHDTLGGSVPAMMLTNDEEFMLDYLAKFPNPNVSSGSVASIIELTAREGKTDDLRKPTTGGKRPDSQAKITHAGNDVVGLRSTQGTPLHRNSGIPMNRHPHGVSPDTYGRLYGKLMSTTASASSLPLMGSLESSSTGNKSGDTLSRTQRSLPIDAKDIPHIRRGVSMPIRMSLAKGVDDSSASPMEAFLTLSQTLNDQLGSLEHELDDIAMHVVRAF